MQRARTRRHRANALEGGGGDEARRGFERGRRAAPRVARLAETTKKPRRVRAGAGPIILGARGEDERGGEDRSEHPVARRGVARREDDAHDERRTGTTARVRRDEATRAENEATFESIFYT